MTTDRISLTLLCVLLIGCQDAPAPSSVPPVATLSEVQQQLTSAESVPSALKEMPGSATTPADPATPAVASPGLPAAAEDQIAQSSPSQSDSNGATPAKRHTAQKVAILAPHSDIPSVKLSTGHAKLCKVSVGDLFPAITLPVHEGKESDLQSLRGKKATIVLFWHPDRWMARTALGDLQRDIASKVDAKQVAVVGIAVHQDSSSVRTLLDGLKVTYPQLLDTKGKAFSSVGSAGLPRIYILNPAGKIVWFDIEYSEGTRREIGWTLDALMEEIP